MRATRHVGGQTWTFRIVGWAGWLRGLSLTQMHVTFVSLTQKRSILFLSRGPATPRQFKTYSLIERFVSGRRDRKPPPAQNKNIELLDWAERHTR